MRPLKVLIVEDEGLVAAGLKGQLEEIGHQVVGFAKDGKQAVGLALNLRPDLIIMDIRIPGMDGIEAARAILAQEAIPIVFLTAHDSFEYARSALRLRVEDFLLKPASPEEVAAALRRVLSDKASSCSEATSLLQRLDAVAARRKK